MRYVHTDARCAVIAGDCVEVMNHLPEGMVHAIITDPPYDLRFMGSEWDTTGIAFSVDTWRAALRLLKPGGHLAAFGAPRTWHRLAVAIEDAGFEIRDSIMWIRGDGMPKGYNLERASEEWAGWSTSLKPGVEPIVLARKPFPGTVAANVLAHGTGALNIGACRIGTEERVNQPGSTKPRTAMGDGWREDAKPQPAVGRWPANVLLDEAAAAELDAQSGMLTSGKAAEGGHHRNAPKVREGIYGGGKGLWKDAQQAGELYGDSGGASRFFYVPKAPRSERPEVNGVKHPTVKPLTLMRWLTRLITPPGGLIVDMFAGSGTTGEAALSEGFRTLLIEKNEEYIPLIMTRLQPAIIGGTNGKEFQQ